MLPRLSRALRLVVPVMAERSSAAFPLLRKGEKQTAENQVYTYPLPARNSRRRRGNTRVILAASQRFRVLELSFLKAFLFRLKSVGASLQRSEVALGDRLAVPAARLPSHAGTAEYMARCRARATSSLIQKWFVLWSYHWKKKMFCRSNTMHNLNALKAYNVFFRSSKFVFIIILFIY